MCSFPERSSLLGRHGLARRSGVDPQHHPIGQPQIDRLDIALQQAVRPFERRQAGPRGAGVFLGQQHVDRIVDPQVPAAVVDPDRGGNPRGKLGLVRQHVDERGGMARGIVADHRRQPGKTAEVGDRDHRPLAIDQLLLAAVLPYRERVAFDQPDHEGAGQAPLDRGRAHPRQALQLLLSPGSG